ncbi:copper amine oxidase [Apiospora marii]|uniref:Amine oxidase n=1 Tax=Apiospora marii TaxID=335849 RepID=A0ABR1REX0_9PEZI
MTPDTSTIPGYIIYRDDANGSSPNEIVIPKPPPHPLDQLTVEEISVAAKLIRNYVHPQTVKFNCLTLREPRKGEYQAFQAGSGPRPQRRAFAIVIERGSGQVSEFLVSLSQGGAVESRKNVTDVGPMLTLEDLDICERVARADAQVAAACREVGIADMSRVFFDGWAIGHDARWGFERRLQQGLAYYRAAPLDNQYAHPLDFTVIIDTEREEVLAVDVRRVNGERVPPPLEEHNYLPQYVGDGYDHHRLKPIDIVQPQGVSFEMRGNELSWAGYKMHIGFNFREGIVISDVRMHDMHEQRERSLFNRISVVEMVVPYGNPTAPHQKKHAFDVGEYGTGLMTNSLKLGCDCKGAIHYLDAVMSISDGSPAVLKNAVCIHEEDNGLLYKHTDYRDGTVIAARDRRLVVSQIITAANYEYGFYHTFSLDGTYRLEVKLTGMLNTYCLHPSEAAAPYGTEVARGLDAHNHQHIFSLRVDPAIDGPRNSVLEHDALPSEHPVGSVANPFGNGFYSKATLLQDAREGMRDYRHETSRSWSIVNPHRLNPSSKKPVGYKILNNSCPPLLAQPGSVVRARAAFARHTLWVLPYRDDELFPAGDYVCQSTGVPGHVDNPTIEDWAARGGNIADADIVCFIQFGLTHFPRTEDFPVMPAEPVSVMLRAANFFVKNPALWVPPTTVFKDTTSRDAFPASGAPVAEGDATSCCSEGPVSSKL